MTQEKCELLFLLGQKRGAKQFRIKQLSNRYFKRFKKKKVIALNNPVTYWKNVSHPDTKCHQRAFHLVDTLLQGNYISRDIINKCFPEKKTKKAIHFLNKYGFSPVLS